MELTGGDPWWALVPEEARPAGTEAALRAAGLWGGPDGDRSQELVLIGAGLDRAGLTAAFDGCLLTGSPPPSRRMLLTRRCDPAQRSRSRHCVTYDAAGPAGEEMATRGADGAWALLDPWPAWESDALE